LIVLRLVAMGQLLFILKAARCYKNFLPEWGLSMIHQISRHGISKSFCVSVMTISSPGFFFGDHCFIFMSAPAFKFNHDERFF
jgi:hypothetical protein